MKIVLVARSIENIGVEYLSAILKQKGYSVSLVFDPALFENFHFYNKFLAECLSYEDIISEEIENIKPGLIAFSVLSDDFSWALRIAGCIKKRNNTPVIFGGIHPTSVPELVIKEKVIDYVCIGEGEEPMVELLDALEHSKDSTSIKNIWAKKNGKIIRNPIRRLNENLDNVPFPDKDIFYDKYPIFKDQAYKIITARGCPNACSYCYNSYLRSLYKGKGKYLRRRSVDNVISELLLAKKKYKINRVVFLDDTFIYDRNWLKSFAVKYKEAINLPFNCTIHPSFIDKEVVKLLKASGCVIVNMGIQDINERLRREVLNRKDTNIEIKRAIRMVTKSNIFMYTTAIFGLPDQGERELIETINFLNKYRPDVPDSNWLRYYPKTSIVDFAISANLLSVQEVERINSAPEFRPYGLGGHSFNIKSLRFRNVLFLTCILSKRTIEQLIKKKLYYLIPPIDMRKFVLIVVFIYNKVFKKRKYIYPVFSVFDIFIYHVYFLFKKVLYKLEINKMLGK